MVKVEFQKLSINLFTTYYVLGVINNFDIIGFSIKIMKKFETSIRKNVFKNIKKM